MEYIKGFPYFCDCKGKIEGYPYLRHDISCELLIIGGGIDGAIANFFLSQNHDVVLVDKGRFGHACTACATALLEYQLDDFADDLLEYMSEEEILQSYRMGLASIEKIKNFVARFGNQCHFSARPTFLYTNSIFSVKAIENEFLFRKKHNFDCKLFSKEDNPFPFSIKKGIYSPNGGCEFNPYLFTKQMIKNSLNQNRLFENTHIINLKKSRHGIIARTNFGERIFCQKVIVATGFNWEILEQELCERFISYSIVTSPLPQPAWKEKALLHDASSPYHYCRTLPDGRVIFGGEDTPFHEKPVSEKLASRKYKALEKSLRRLLSLPQSVTIDYRFCGSFGTTKNNLGLIGESKTDDDILLFISCGANGIINAFCGVEIIEGILSGNPHPLAPLFSPKRESI